MVRLQDHMISIRNGKVSKGSRNWHDQALSKTYYGSSCSSKVEAWQYYKVLRGKDMLYKEATKGD